MSDNIHKTHFPVTKEMPWHIKEKKALKLFQLILNDWNNDDIDIDEFVGRLSTYVNDNEELVDWIVKHGLG